jgi:hypothetical protein
MNKLEEILESYDNEELMIADGFDDAVIGICHHSQKLIYSYQKCVNILVSNDDMQEIDAIEYLDFNTINSYVGEKTPIWCMDI